MRVQILLLSALLLGAGCQRSTAAPPRAASDATRATADAAPAPAQAAPCPRATALTPAELGAEVSCLLSRYVQIDTTNPPGNELAAATFLRDVLAREGIEAHILESAPGRANLYARLKGAGEGKAVVLVHHMDVVPASAEEWSVPPLSGTLRDGYVWGRGSFDNKGAGVMFFVAAMMAKRLGKTLPRDLILLAVADEEAGSAHGARFLMDKHFALFADAELVLNEGGGVVLPAPGVAMARVEVAQKAPLWLRLTAHGPSGHASRPGPQTATGSLVAALDKLSRHRFEVKVVEAVQAVFAERAPSAPPELRARFADLQKALGDEAFREKFLADPQQAALVRNTLAITMLEASDKENVIAPTASAVLDMRLLPGEDPAAVIAELQRVMADPSLEIETLLSWQAHASPRDTPLFGAIEKLLAEQQPPVPVTANVIGGFTDCNAFRARGLVCYGFLPMRVDLSELARIHGKDERVSVEGLAQGVIDTHRLLELLP